MGNQQILVLFLKALVAAKKSLALYPAGSQMASEWVQRLHRSLRSFFQEGMTFPIQVSHDRFVWEQDELVMLDPILEALRFDLETRGIAEFSIDPGVEEWELEQFLRLLNTPAASLESIASAAEYLRARNVLHLTVRGPALGRRGPEHGLPVTEPGGVEDEVESLVQAVLELLAQRLADLTYDRKALLVWLGALGAGTRVETLVAALRLLGALAAGAGDRELRIRTMMEAVLDLPEGLRRSLLTTWLVPAAGTDLTAFNMLTQLTEDELGQVAQDVPDDQLLGLATELNEFPWEAGKRQRLLESVGAALQRKGLPERTAPLLEALAKDDPLVVGLREEIVAACHSDQLLERSVRILLALILHVDNEEYPGFALDALEETIGEAIARNRLDLALDVLKSLADLSQLPHEWAREHPGRLALFLRRAASRPHILLAAGLLRGPTGSEQIPPVAEFLRIVGRAGVEEFTTLLAEEKGRAVRARMCQVLARVGPAVVPGLLRWLEDGRWFVARNVVNVLGKIGDQGAFLSVVAQVDHPHPRVRLETVRALGLMGGRAAVGPLIRCLTDADAEVRSAAVKVLGSLQDDDAVPALRALVEGRGRDGPDELAFKQEAIQALVATGTRRAREALRELAGRRLWFWKRAERRVRAMASAALATTSVPAPATTATWSEDA